jgi:hypothetical protein
MFLAQRMWITVRILQQAGLLFAEHIKTLLCRDKDKHYMTSYIMVYKAMSHVALPRTRELYPAPKFVAYNKRIALIYSYLTVLHAWMIQINNAPLIISDKKPKYREGKLLAY